MSAPPRSSNPHDDSQVRHPLSPLYAKGGRWTGWAVQRVAQRAELDGLGRRAEEGGCASTAGVVHAAPRDRTVMTR
jgi:hypothetical protein